jgi:hypothetical protein
MAKKNPAETPTDTAVAAATDAPAAEAKPKRTPKPKPEPKPKPVVDRQNDITRPAANTKCGQIWALADAAANAAGGRDKVLRKDVIEEARKLGINDATSATQYGRWRQYHGMVQHREAAAPVAEAA